MTEQQVRKMIEDAEDKWMTSAEHHWVNPDDVLMSIRISFRSDLDLDDDQMATGNHWDWIDVTDKETVMPVRSYTVYYAENPLWNFSTVTVDGFRCIVPIPDGGVDANRKVDSEGNIVLSIPKWKDGVGRLMNGRQTWNDYKHMLKIKADEI